MNKITHWSKFKKVLFSIIFVFCIFIVLLGLMMNSYLSKINRVTIDKNNLSINNNIFKEESNLNQNEDIFNIALFGIDETSGVNGRSDAIMILTIDNKHNKLKLSSIIRDSYVIIPNKNKKDKINHAYAFGGPELALKTLNENFNLNLAQFISVDFSSLPKIIDSIGGITLNITADELKYINSYIDSLNNLNNSNSPNITTSGVQKLDGTQSLAYCRIRYTDGGDFERSQRHRTVVNQLIEKCKTIPFTRYSSIINTLLPFVYTNLDTSEILSIAKNINSLKSENLLQDRFPRDEDGHGENIGGVYYYVFDEKSTTQKINNFIFEQ